MPSSQVCRGNRYNREALEIKFRGKNIAEVLDMTVDQGMKYIVSLGLVSMNKRQGKKLLRKNAEEADES